jgi:hypothetical protein
MHKENNIKIKNIEEYNFSLTMLNSDRQNNLVHDPNRASHTSCLIANINICKYGGN